MARWYNQNQIEHSTRGGGQRAAAECAGWPCRRWRRRHQRPLGRCRGGARGRAAAHARRASVQQSAVEMSVIGLCVVACFTVSGLQRHGQLPPAVDQHAEPAAHGTVQGTICFSAGSGGGAGEMQTRSLEPLCWLFMLSARLNKQPDSVLMVLPVEQSQRCFKLDGAACVSWLCV